MTPSIHRLTTTPTSTAEAITASTTYIEVTSADDVTNLAWETVDFPSATTDDIASYLSSTAADLVSELGLFAVDLSDFLANCLEVDTCQYDAYANRYDGLALGHWVDLAGPSTALTITFDGTTSHDAGDDVANLPASVGLCDADTFICWGWHLEGTYTSTIDATDETSTVTYVATFSSGVSEWAFDATTPSDDEVLALFGTDLLDVSPDVSTTGYGFSNVYWHTDADTSDVWPQGVLTYRFQAVDLPRYSVDDTITIWSLGSYESDSVNNVETADIVLANAHMLLSTATAALVCSTLL